MPKPSSKTPQRIERLLALHKQGASAREIAEELGLGHTTISEWLRGMGLEANGGQGPRKRRKRPPLPQVAAAMAEAQRTLAEVANGAPADPVDPQAKLQRSLAIVDGVIAFVELGIRNGTSTIHDLQKAMAVQKELLWRIREITPQAPADPSQDPSNIEAANETRERFRRLVEAAEQAQTNGGHHR
jgi:hypothetical protein